MTRRPFDARWYSQYEDDDTGTLTREEWARLRAGPEAPRQVAEKAPRGRCPVCRKELPDRERTGRTRRTTYCSPRCVARDRKRGGT